MPCTTMDGNIRTGWVFLIVPKRSLYLVQGGLELGRAGNPGSTLVVSPAPYRHFLEPVHEVWGVCGGVPFP